MPRLTIVLSDAEYKTIERAAGVNGITPAQFVHKIVMDMLEYVGSVSVTKAIYKATRSTVDVVWVKNITNSWPSELQSAYTNGRLITARTLLNEPVLVNTDRIVTAEIVDDENKTVASFDTARGAWAGNIKRIVCRPRSRRTPKPYHARIEVLQEYIERTSAPSVVSNKNTYGDSGLYGIDDSGIIPVRDIRGEGEAEH